MPAGRKPRGETAMTGAERQARYRARQAGDPGTDGQAAAVAGLTPGKTRKLTRPQRWNAASGELIAVQGECVAWYEAMPEAFRDTPTGQALLAIIELDLEEIASIQLPKGYGRD